MAVQNKGIHCEAAELRIRTWAVTQFRTGVPLVRKCVFVFLSHIIREHSGKMAHLFNCPVQLLVLRTHHVLKTREIVIFRTRLNTQCHK